jgi:TonB family protein
MKTDRLPTDPAAHHVPLERLRRYQADALSAAERHQVEKHLLDCELCADILEGLAASPAPVTRRAVQDINTRLAATLGRKRKARSFYNDRKNWSVAAAILIFVLSGVVVFYYNLTNVKRAEKTTGVNTSVMTRKTETIVKPAIPSVAEKPQPEFKVDSVSKNPVLALRTPKASISSRPGKPELPVMSAPRQEEPNKYPAIGKSGNQELLTEMPAVLIPDTPAVATAPKVAGIESDIQGRAAGVAINKSKVTLKGTNSGALRENSSVVGRLVSGRVSDETGEAIPGVTVAVKGTQVGAVTNARGEYNLTLPEESSEATLVFSFIGYNTTEKQVSNLVSPLALNVSMTADAKSLSEVVVVGYGSQPKINNTGAIVYARPGAGFKAYKKYIQENLKYPEEAKQNKIKGRVIVGFTVSPGGELSGFKVLKGLSPECDAEALRLVQEGPHWEPTTKDGVAVSEQVRLGIRFKPAK